MGAGHLYFASQWMMAEMVRTISGLPMGEAGKLIEGIQAPLDPEHVSHLVFWCSFSRGSDLLASRQSQGLAGLIDKDWELSTETAASVIFGWSAGEPARQFARYMRESATPEMVRASMTVLGEVDVSGLLPKIRCPSLVLHRRHIEYLGLDAAKLLASRIPDGRFVAFDGDSTQIYSDADAILTAVDGFLGSEEEEVRND